MIIYESRKHRRTIHLLNTKEGLSPRKHEPEHNPSKIKVTGDRHAGHRPPGVAAETLGRGQLSGWPVTKGRKGLGSSFLLVPPWAWRGRQPVSLFPEGDSVCRIVLGAPLDTENVDLPL